MNGSQVTGVLVVGGGAIALLYFFGKKPLSVAGAAPGVTGSLASLLSPGRGGPATVNAGGRTIAAAPPPTAYGAGATYAASTGGSSGSFPNIIAAAGSLLAGLGKAFVPPGPGQAPAQPVNNTPVFSASQTQGLATLSALTARAQDTNQVSYSALPDELVDPGYGTSAPDISGLVTGLDAAALPDLSGLDAANVGADEFYA